MLWLRYAVPFHVCSSGKQQLAKRGTDRDACVRARDACASQQTEDDTRQKQKMALRQNVQVALAALRGV